MQERLATNKPYDQTARKLISAEGETAFNGPVNFLVTHRDEPAVKVSRIFLGVRMDCARCHDHPFARWTQDDYARFEQFFESMKLRETSNSNIELFESPRNRNDDRPRFLTGATPQTTRWRDELALFITTCRPFARNYANRMWYQLLGRGIVNPPDDFSANEPVAPELLEYLADYARETDFRPKDMIRAICLSQAYQRESGHSDSLDQAALFGSFTPKPLTFSQKVRVHFFFEMGVL